MGAEVVRCSDEEEKQTKGLARASHASSAGESRESQGASLVGYHRRAASLFRSRPHFLHESTSIIRNRQEFAFAVLRPSAQHASFLTGTRSTLRASTWQRHGTTKRLCHIQEERWHPYRVQRRPVGVLDACRSSRIAACLHLRRVVHH